MKDQTLQELLGLRCVYSFIRTPVRSILSHLSGVPLEASILLVAGEQLLEGSSHYENRQHVHLVMDEYLDMDDIYGLLTDDTLSKAYVKGYGKRILAAKHLLCSL